ncbi:hypothetical protein FOCC_FOCC001183 [Frankliniella occidentalis]|nr:hypothetical protein FOCC_FOCC001183 [Frankliniella occidentalis]
MVPQLFHHLHNAIWIAFTKIFIFELLSSCSNKNIYTIVLLKKINKLHSRLVGVRCLKFPLNIQVLRETHPFQIIKEVAGRGETEQCLQYQEVCMEGNKVHPALTV